MLGLHLNSFVSQIVQNLAGKEGLFSAASFGALNILSARNMWGSLTSAGPCIELAFQFAQL